MISSKFSNVFIVCGDLQAISNNFQNINVFVLSHLIRCLNTLWPNIKWRLVQAGFYVLNNFMLVVSFYTTWKYHKTNAMLCTIWYNLYNLKNVKKSHGGVLLLVKFTKSNTLPWVLFTFLNCTNSTKSRKALHMIFRCFLMFSESAEDQSHGLMRKHHCSCGDNLGRPFLIPFLVLILVSIQTRCLKWPREHGKTWRHRVYPKMTMICENSDAS